MLVGAKGTLHLDPGGEATLQWTSAWRGVLMMRGQDLRANHPMQVHDYYSICLVDRGEGEIHCRGRTFQAREGSVLLLSPWEAHLKRVMSAGWSLRAFYPASGTMQRVIGERGRVLELLEFDSPLVIDHELADCLARLFSRLENSPFAVIEDALTDTVRASLRRHLRLKADQGGIKRADRAVQAVQTRILNSPHEMTSMAELSELAGMSRYHLSRIFRDRMGLPPYAYFEEVRMARAQLLMREGMALSEVAIALGYSDQSHFHRQFRARAATTPGRYARALRAVFCSDDRSRPRR